MLTVTGKFPILDKSEIGIFIQQSVPFRQLFIAQLLQLEIVADLLHLILETGHLIDIWSNDLMKKDQ